MRVVNVSKEPFEWTYNSGIYGPVAPGEVMEFPDDVAGFGVKKSERLDDLGNPTGEYRLQPVGSFSSARLEEFASFHCSLCTKGPFRKDELKMHMMETHFGTPAPPPTQAASGEAGPATSRPFRK